MVKTNDWRCLDYCNNCPFKDNGEKIQLADGRVDKIKKYLLENDHHSFSCHKTVYSLDDKMQPTTKQKPKMCYGAYKFLKEQKRPNILMRLGELFDKSE